MKKTYLMILTLHLLFFSRLQAQLNKNIIGEISKYKINNDTIIFSNGLINEKFYNVNDVLSVIINGKFSVKFLNTYPHLFNVSFKSERDSVLYRAGNYFLDNSTNFIKINNLDYNSNIEGKTSTEYENNFIPYFLSKNIEYSEENFMSLWFEKKEYFDQKLLSYVRDNPDSYVALWFLIKRVDSEGYAKLYEDILFLFSKKLKQEKLWRILYNDIKNIRIRENKKFPNLTLKDKNLNTVSLKLPEAKYTLVDYWFNRCIPCLKSFPKLKKIYALYKSKGFKIVGISVDKTKEVINWKKRIKDNKLDWIHYLDENGREAQIDKILNFPTTFLLDESGKIIKKNIKLKDLENFLEQKLN